MPIRFRLLTGFVAAMAVLLAATGVFVYWRVRIDLDSALDRNLNEDFTTTLALVGPDGHVADVSGPGTAPPTREHQTLAADGTVVSSGPGVGDRPLLSTSQLRRALKGPTRIDTGALLRASPRPFRLLAQPIAGHGPAAILVVGIERDQRDEALRELLATLALAGVGALLVAALVGERLAHAALAPVERYRSQAAAIADGATGTRLDVPASRDDELTRLGHTFNDVLDALERALERERRFVNDASHELRTPLTLMSARVQLLLRRHRTVEQHERALVELQTEISDLIALSDQLLDLGALIEAQAAVPDDPVELSGRRRRDVPPGHRCHRRERRARTERHRPRDPDPPGGRQPHRQRPHARPAARHRLDPASRGRRRGRRHRRRPRLPGPASSPPPPSASTAVTTPTADPGPGSASPSSTPSSAATTVSSASAPTGSTTGSTRRSRSRASTPTTAPRWPSCSRSSGRAGGPAIT